MKAGLKPPSCQVCGTGISPGNIFYIGRTEIISGSDGILSETEESADRVIEKAIGNKQSIKRAGIHGGGISGDQTGSLWAVPFNFQGWNP